MIEMHDIDSPIKDHAVAPSDSELPIPTECTNSQRHFEKPAVTVSATATKAATDWWAIAKGNLPSILSILSVLTNVIILSALIPSMKQDISYALGQASVLNTQVAGFSQLLSGLQEKITGADTQITKFNSRIADIGFQLNSTEQTAAEFRDQTIASLQTLQNTSATILASFNQSSAVIELQLSTSLASATAQGGILQQQAAAAEERVILAISKLDNATTISTAQLSSLNDTVVTTFIDSFSQFQQLSTNSVATVVGLTNTFVNRTVPQLTADLQRLNQSSQIQQLRDQMTHRSFAAFDFDAMDVQPHAYFTITNASLLLPTSGKSSIGWNGSTVVLQGARQGDIDYGSSRLFVVRVQVRFAGSASTHAQGEFEWGIVAQPNLDNYLFVASSDFGSGALNYLSGILHAHFVVDSDMKTEFLLRIAGLTGGTFAQVSQSRNNAVAPWQCLSLMQVEQM